jgi:golgi phosphoprotein 3
MLTFAEEFLLLAHDEKTGEFADLSYSVMNVALAGAALMDLALLGRIDTDLEQLVLVDRAPIGEALLDFCLVKIAGAEGVMDARGWVELLADEGAVLQEMALDRLVERGILKRDDKRFLWVFSHRVYPMIDNREIVEVKKRISALVFSDDIPDPRDIVLLALADSSGLLTHIFSPEEIDRRRARIKQVARMDLIGQAVYKVINEIQTAVMMSIHGAF